MFRFATTIGKVVKWSSRRLGGGHGSALPGLIAEKICPDYLARLLGDLPHGIVLISGTNGKTTTTKIVADLLRADGYRVFTNSSGSNYVRGVISSALPYIKRGRLQADIAVLELDEAYATPFVNKIKPRYSLLLNVLRDQLDRFGEIDKTANLLHHVAVNTTKTVIINRDDPRLAAFLDDEEVSADIKSFGASGQASRLYKTDEEIHGHKKKQLTKIDKQTISIDKYSDGNASYVIDGDEYGVQLKLFGIHNALNCAAALAVVRAVEGENFNTQTTVDHLSNLAPAFGRGELIRIDGRDVRLVLVKNPSGFQLSLDSSAKVPTLIIINDEHADGRDVSWLWDVDFVNWSDNSYIATSGVRAFDMAVRLQYDGVSVQSSDLDTEQSLKKLINKIPVNGHGQIFATYTAMLKVRDELENMASKGEGN